MPPFYTLYLQLPEADSPIPPKIRDNPKFHPFFDGALGAIDGTHILCIPSATDRDASRNRKGELTQNCLAACTFDLRFTYFLSGWEGSTHDSTLFNEARQTDFHIPKGRYYLADAGFASSDVLLVPYRNVRYHLSEWDRAKRAYVVLLSLKLKIYTNILVSPRNPKELFNLRHASARNVVERIFGVLKRRFRILHSPPAYDMDIQSLIPAALAALHNFIRIYDPDDIDTDVDEPIDFRIGPDPRDVGELGGNVTPAERVRANARRDTIAASMWEQYQGYLESHAAHDE
jgi:DDE superfamily endonuclease